MTPGLSDRARTLRRTGLVAFGVALAVFQVGGFVGLRINLSPSLPMGLYLTTPNANASMVEFCPVEPFATFAIKRGYRDPGTCRDGAAPLLKPVVAKSGDVVEVSPRGIAVNGTLLPNTAPLTKDTKGRTLDAWPSGRYVVDEGTVWVASTYHPRSFDSRYFGPIPETIIRNRVKPFLTL